METGAKVAVKILKPRTDLVTSSLEEEDPEGKVHFGATFRVKVQREIHRSRERRVFPHDRVRKRLSSADT